MKRVRKRLIITAGSALLASQTFATFAPQSELSAIDHSIIHLKEKLFASTSKKSLLQEDLQHIETTIGGAAKTLSNTQAELHQHQQALNRLEEQRNQYQYELQQQQALLTQQIQAAYMLGRQPYLKILLNQEDPAKVDRFLYYYETLTAARETTITQIQQTLQAIDQSEAQIREETEALENTKSKAQNLSEKLERERGGRQQVLMQLESSIGTEEEQLNVLIANKAHLQSVINKVGTQKYHSTPMQPGKNIVFAPHQLPWPVATTRILQRFGEPLAGGRMQSSGLLLAAPMGTKISPVYPGTVVFANWLRGYGLLVIVQHSDTYMSLYAHAESLYVKPGDHVVPGQEIATVGDSGGLSSPALYFEITRYGQAIDPFPWLRS